MDHLLAARSCLRATLESSRALDAAIEGTSPRLAGVRRRLPALEASVRPALASGAALAAAAGHIDRAVGPAAAVLKVFDAVRGLEPALLSGPGDDDLGGYLALVRRLEEALRFLADNCGLAVRWLEEVAEFLQENSVADGKYIAAFKASLRSLKDSSAASLDGGLLEAALDRLESEFLRLLSSNSTPLPMNLPDSSDQVSITPSPLPVPVIQKLKAILQRLAASHRLDRAVRIYAEVRGSNVRESLRALDLDYLETSAGSDDVQSIEEHIAQWGKHLEFAVKHLFEGEFKLCSDVFERFGPGEVARECFADIVMKAGFLVFLQFGTTVVETKKDPIKLLKLLDVFALLNNLRLDFNRLFGGKACAEIQTLTRDLIKRLVEEACEIFRELLVQVELQRRTPPSPNAAVPKLVDFITDYCNRLLSDEYRPVLNQILYIHKSWKHEKYDGKLLTDRVQDIIRALEQNFEAWGRAHEAAAAKSHLFLMSAHWHLHQKAAGTRLGDLLGEAWLKELEQYKDYYAEMYMRESWGRLPPLLSPEGLVLFSGGRATARDLVKRRLKEFNAAFDEAYRRQSGWVVADGELRARTCQMAVQAVVPVYRSYMQSYGALVEQDPAAGRCAKYSPQALERMLCSMFQSKSGRSASFAAARHSSGSFNSTAVTSQYKSAPTAV